MRVQTQSWPRQWGGIDSEKEEQQLPEPKEIPALLEILVEAMKRDGGERK